MKRLSACKVLWSTFRWIGALPVKLLARCCKSFSFSRSFGFNNLRSVEVFQPNLWSCSVTHDDSALRRVDNCDEVVSINCPHSSVSWIIVNRNRVEKCWWWVFISRQICFLIFNEEYLLSTLYTEIELKYWSYLSIFIRVSTHLSRLKSWWKYFSLVITTLQSEPSYKKLQEAVVL